MNWKTIVVLLLACIGLGFFLLRESAREKTGPQEENKNYLVSFEPASVVGLNAVFLDSTFVLRKLGEEWVMAQPFGGHLADSMTVNHLLKVLSRIVVQQSVAVDSIDLAQVRLDKPVLSFTLHFNAGDSSRLNFGVLNPTTENIYVRRNEEDMVMLINRLYGPMLGVSDLMLRGKGLIETKPYQVRRIRYGSHERPLFAASRETDNGDWWIETPGGKVLGNKRSITDLLSRLYENQVREFHPLQGKTGSETGLRNPVRSFWIEGGNGDTTAVSIGNSTEDEYLRWAESSLYPQELLLVDTSLVSILDKFSIQGLQNLQMTTFQPDQVDRIELMTPMDTLVIVAENDTIWQIIEPEKVGCKLWQIELLLIHADTMGAMEILPPSSGKGFEHPQLTLSLYGGEKVLARILVGDYAGDKAVYMRDDLRQMDFIAPEREFQRLNYTLKDLADVPVRHVVQ
ncbi:MAG TPA: DUF4340 domain-containing protein [archaeon]|nr:DUF4340 domain-containing protein [archaeon]